MKAIDTVYNGYKFRSRLEARWAIFFDSLGIKYQYEPEGFESSETGEKYLPDFYLPDTKLRGYGDMGVYLEIKPDNFEGYELGQSRWFTENLVLFIGAPDKNCWESENYDYDGGYEICDKRHLREHGTRGWDNCMRVWICSKCSQSKIEFLEGNYNECCNKGCNGTDDFKKSHAAYLKARQARFEHGETPVIR